MAVTKKAKNIKRKNIKRKNIKKRRSTARRSKTIIMKMKAMIIITKTKAMMKA